MAGRSAHVRRTSNEHRSSGERRRSSSHGDATPRLPAPPALGLALGSSTNSLLHPHDAAAAALRRSNSSQPHAGAASMASMAINTQTNASRDGQGAAQLQATGPTVPTGEQQGQQPPPGHPSRLLGFLGLSDMLQSTSAGLLATSAVPPNVLIPNGNVNASAHPHLAAAAHSVLAATSFLHAAVPHHRSATTPSPLPGNLLPTRTHSRGESVAPFDRSVSPAPSSMTAVPTPSIKGHTSPSKASSTRTYDSKLVTREMHRLGNLTHLPSLAAPALTLSTAPSSLSLNMASASVPSINATLSGENPWASLHVLILPLFNREQLRVQIEDLNQLVKRHIATVVSMAPGKAVATLENDTFDLIATGMVTLNSKLTGVEDDKLVLCVLDLWTFFWTQVLPYLEGALLPLQTDPVLLSLYRQPKSLRPISPTSAQNGKSSTSNLLFPSPIDVRALALVSFRDRIILPLFTQLYARLTISKDEAALGPTSLQARLQQMLLVLVSQRSQRLVSLSLTSPPPAPTAGEAALARLLRALHAPLPRQTRPAGAPSFLSAGLPRDRRGRIAHKQKAPDAGSPRGWGAGREQWRWKTAQGEDEEDEDGDVESGTGSGTGDADDADGESAVRWRGRGGAYGPYDAGSSAYSYSYWEEAEADTPRVGASFADPVRARDKELLESLRSPDAAQMSRAGWPAEAGIPDMDTGEDEDGEDEEYEREEDMDWDQAQAMVEHLVGVTPQQQQGAGRARPPVEGYM